MLRSDEIVTWLKTTGSPDPLVITPQPNLETLRKSGAASIDLRLGTWFGIPRHSRVPVLQVYEDRGPEAAKPGVKDGNKHIGPVDDAKVVDTGKPTAKHEKKRGDLEVDLLKTVYVPFGYPFFLHPRNFVLGITLEWIRLPSRLAGYIMGRSSWGRRGLVIATASGVQPGFTGCLTLELTNLGEVPIEIRPGTPVSQLFLHETGGPPDAELVDQSKFAGMRKPMQTAIKLDPIAKALANGPNHS